MKPEAKNEGMNETFNERYILCTFSSMLLPETRGKRLPDTIAEAELIGA